MTDHAIRTTFRPDQVVQVSDQEFQDLTRMGVVLPEEPETPAPEPQEVEYGHEEEPEADGGQAPEPEEV